MPKFSSTDSGATVLSKLNNTVVTVGTETGADYICDGVADDVQIQAAVDYIDSLGGGEVFIRRGTYAISSSINCYSSSGHYNNITIRGEGRNSTILQATANNVSMLTFGNGAVSAGIITSNLKFCDFTLDMNNKTGATYGLALGCCKDVLIDNIHIKNQKNGAKAMLFFGVISGASSDMVSRNLLVTNSIFSDSDAAWEGITLSGAYNCKFVNCTFRDKTAQKMLLNYDSYNVAISNCDFINATGYSNGHGETLISNCTFFSCGWLVQADNNTFLNCSFNQFDHTKSASITFTGYQVAANEAGWDETGAGAIVTLKNNKVIGCTFDHGNSYAITATTFNDSDLTKHLSCDDLTISNCSFGNTYWQGIYVYAKKLILTENVFYNNNNIGTSTTNQNMIIGATNAIIANNVSYDDQDTPTVAHDFLIDNQRVGDVLTTQDITMSGNHFLVGGVPYFYDSGFTTAKPSNITIRYRNNVGLVTENSGTGTIASGATTAVITHGLSVTPTLKDISIVFGEQGSNDYGRWWISSITSTQFTLNVSSDPGASGLDFAWRAIVL